MKDLNTVVSEFIDQRFLAESSKYDGGNEFNHLEQAIFASKELENSLRSLRELNPGKYERFGDTLKKIRKISDEFPPMLDSLKGSMNGESPDENWWEDDDNGDDNDDAENNEDYEGAEGAEDDENDEFEDGDPDDYEDENEDDESKSFEFED